MMPAGSANGMTSGTFFLSGYPRGVAVGQLLSRNDRLVALKSGTKGDLVNLDYGTVWVPEVSEDEKNAAADAKAKTAAKVLAWQKEQADKGDAYGEYKMGVRYMNGDGVDKNLDKARDLLSKSAAQGNTDASNEMAKLPSSN
jgi:TPR repeat protein